MFQAAGVSESLSSCKKKILLLLTDTFKSKHPIDPIYLQKKSRDFYKVRILNLADFTFSFGTTKSMLALVQQFTPIEK